MDDAALKREVEAELAWDAEIDATDVGVAVAGGVVTLTGFVRSYHDRTLAQRAVKRIHGVRAVADEIQVRLPSQDSRTDRDIAREAVAELRRQLPRTSDALTVTVVNGRVFLEGFTPWAAVRLQAEEAVARLRGVSSVWNSIQIAPPAPPVEVARAIEQALVRRSLPHPEWLSIGADGGEVTLRGAVRRLPDRDLVEWTALHAPGVVRVNNLIAVRPGRRGPGVPPHAAGPV